MTVKAASSSVTLSGTLATKFLGTQTKEKTIVTGWLSHRWDY